jgi:hypothetical protein
MFRTVFVLHFHEHMGICIDHARYVDKLADASIHSTWSMMHVRLVFAIVFAQYGNGTCANANSVRAYYYHHSTIIPVPIDLHVARLDIKNNANNRIKRIVSMAHYDQGS